LWKTPQRLVGQWRTMKAWTCLDAPLVGEAHGQGSVVAVGRVDGKYRQTALDRVLAIGLELCDALETLKQPGAEFLFTSADLFTSRFADPFQCAREPGDARKVGRSRLELVGHGHRLALLVGEAARPAFHEGRHCFGEFRFPQDAADSLGSQKPLVAGKAKGRKIQFFCVDVKHPARLGRVEDQGHTVGAADAGDLLQRLDGSTHIAGMADHDHVDLVAFEQLLQVGGVEFTGSGAGEYGKPHAFFLESAQGPDDGVVLHGGGHHVVSLSKVSLENDVEGLRHIRREGDVP